MKAIRVWSSNRYDGTDTVILGIPTVDSLSLPVRMTPAQAREIARCLIETAELVELENEHSAPSALIGA
jgi:hypothetical protein